VRFERVICRLSKLIQNRCPPSRSDRSFRTIWRVSCTAMLPSAGYAKELMMGNLQGFAARHHQSCIEISMPEKSQKLRDQSWQTSSILRSHPNRLWSLSRLKQIWLIGHHTSCVGQLPPSDSRAGYHLFCVTSRKMVAINITHPARMLPSNITYSA
jgi:hypothetical protein